MSPFTDMNTPVPKPARGQTLVLLALTMLLLTLMVLMTLSIGTAAARKADLANAADAAAYTTAVATARSFNTGALLNRTIVSHYVAMAGVEAQMVYSSTVHNYFNLAAVMFRLYDDADSNGDGVITYTDSYSEPYALTGCSQRTAEVRDASYEMWHVALRGMRPAGGSNPPDQVNAFCRGSGPQDCFRYRPWLSENEPQLELAATKQADAIHGAIWDLAHIQRRTYRKLERAVRRGDWAAEIADAAKLGTRQVEGQRLGERELDGATGAAASEAPTTFQRPFAEAILGSRRRREPLMLPTVPENLPPMVTQMKAITDAAFAAYPGQPFTVDFTATETSVDYSFQGTASKMIEDPLVAGEPTKNDDQELFPSLKYVVARSVDGRVVTTYRDACLGRVPIRFVSGQRQLNPASGRQVDLRESGQMSTFIRAAGPGQGGGKHVNYGVGHLDGVHWKLATGTTGGSGCHGSHQHYQATDESVHDLGGDTLPQDVLAFALPDNDSRIDEKGARGAWGQPVLPVMLTQKYNPLNDPFSLKVGFKLTNSGSGSTFDMRKAMDRALAPAAAIAYYHRRGHLGEPPNLLNPFWHATLVPLEIDERNARVGGRRYDPTEDSQAAPRRMKNLVDDALPAGEARDTLDAYRGLRNHIPGMSKPAISCDGAPCR